MITHDFSEGKFTVVLTSLKLIIVIISWRSSHFVAVYWLVNDSLAHIREKSTL